MSATPTIYAIDFGTSNSLLAAANADRVFAPAPLDPEGPDPTILRSILCFPDEGGLVVGREALKAFVDHGMEGRLLRSIKRHLGSPSFRGTTIRNRLLTAEALVGAILREMRARANAHFGADVRRALLGRPVHFAGDGTIHGGPAPPQTSPGAPPRGDQDTFAQSRLEAAARLAGFEELHFFPEPVAAARAFGATAERDELALVGDFGGGTSDYTVLRVGAGRAGAKADVLAVGGVAVAGDALDAAIMRSRVAGNFGADVRYRVPFGANELRMPRAIVEHLCSPAHLTILRRHDIAAFLSDVKSWSLGPDDARKMDQLTALVDQALGFHLFEAIERAKRSLSEGEKAVIELSEPGIEVRERVTRKQFEEASAREVDQILGSLDATLAAAGVRAEEIDVTCCTGGTARVPRIAAAIRERLPRARMEQFKTFHSVVEGLAEEARAIERGEAGGLA